MTETIIVSLVAGFLAGVIAALLYRIFSRLKELEKTLIDVIFDTQELIVDVYLEVKNSRQGRGAEEKDSAPNLPDSDLAQKESEEQKISEAAASSEKPDKAQEDASNPKDVLLGDLFMKLFNRARF